MGWFDSLLGIPGDLSYIINVLGGLVAKIDDLNTKVDELQASLDTKQAQIAAAIAAFEQTIADLTAQLGTGGATDSQLQAVIDKLDAAKADLEATPDV
jgi:peptidoglycan hydrolase CwlO-like protein